METPAHSELAYILTRQHFGEKVGFAIKLLFGYDQISLRLAKSLQANHKVEDLKEALLILVKYQLADYVKTVKNFNQQYEYFVVPSRVFHFYRVPKFIQNIYHKEGKIPALALSTLFERGLLSKEKWSEIVLHKMEGHNRCDKNSADLNDIIQHLTFKKYVVSIGENVCINIERLHRDYRDDLIAQTVCKFFNADPKILSLCKTMLRISFDNTDDEAPVTAPVPLQDLENSLCPKDFNDKQILEKYINKLSFETNFRFFVRSGNHPLKGPMYAIDIGSVLEYLVREHVCSVVNTRFGPKCCRVFRLLLLKGPLLLKQIEECIMLPARDVREYTYMLIKEGFIRNRQVPKTPDNAPGKSVFIMSIELDRVVFNLADLCCRSIINLLSRHDFEIQRNNYLLTKSKAVQDLSKSNAQPADGVCVADLDIWNEYFNNHELSQLHQINRTLDKIHYAKIQVDETLFLTHLWIRLRPHMDKYTTC